MIRDTVCIFFAFSVLTGCNSGESTPVTIYPDERIRHISAVDYSSLLASVSFNSGVALEISFASAEPRTVGFTNINQGMFNDYEIVWYELINGVRLTIASQSGQFLADSGGAGSTLSSNYSFAYDSNRNGLTNMTERENGTCPWVACNEQGELLDPQEVTEIISNDVNFVLTKVGPREWLETVDTSGPHDWILSEYTTTSILLHDSTRNFWFDVDLSAGEVRVQDSPENEFRRLYIINGVQ